MMHCTYTVYCDGRQPDCMEHNSYDVGTRTRSEARKDAREGGFVRRRAQPSGRMIDLCPNCAEIHDAALRGMK